MKDKAKKGCINDECVMCKKQKHLHKDDLFCSKCGQPLSFVCEKCHTVLNDGAEKLCIGCTAKKEDNAEKRKKVIGKVVPGVVAVAGAIPAAAAALIKKNIE